MQGRRKSPPSVGDGVGSIAGVVDLLVFGSHEISLCLRKGRTAASHDLQTQSFFPKRMQVFQASSFAVPP